MASSQLVKRVFWVAFWESTRGVALVMEEMVVPAGRNAPEMAMPGCKPAVEVTDTTFDPLVRMGKLNAMLPPLS